MIERLIAGVGTGQFEQFEFAFTRNDNNLEVHVNVGIAAVGDLLSMTLTDIGDLKQREASFRLLFDGNPVPMWLYDPSDLRILSVNDAALAHYGYSRARMQGMSLLDLWPRDEWDIHREIARSVGEKYQSDRTWRHIKADGSEIEVLTYARRLPFANKHTILVAVVDVTERKHAEARIAYMAHHDALTDLPNRVLFHERLERIARPGAAARREPCSALPRSRSLQGRQRYARPSDRRRAVESGRAAAGQMPARQRHGGAARRRRVCRRAVPAGRSA